MKIKRFIVVLLVIFSLCSALAVSASGITESEVQQKVEENGKDAVTGNIFIWFLCAIAFLKVSQKIDSFMSSLGINVGNTGGSLLAEAVIAARGVGMVAKGFSGKGFSQGHSSSGTPTGGGGGFSGGLAGVVGRSFSKSAMSGVTGQGGNVISKKAFQSSMAKGGAFANNVIGSVAKGNISQSGTITGDIASDALVSYMGYTGKEDIPKFEHVEIGGGRITGTEISSENPNGVQFAMYHMDQYMEPKDEYSVVKAADGSQWYMQYAVDSVKKEPYMEKNGTIGYNEQIVKKLPDMPKRKDRV